MLRNLFIFICLFVFSSTGNTQATHWDNLTIPLPTGWSIRQKDGIYEYNNYNLRNAELFSIYLFPAVPYSGKPDTLFANAWKRFLFEAPWADTMPRWRRFYSSGGIPVQQGSLEVRNNEPLAYRQLNVYLLDGVYQACLIETTTAKHYRQIQGEWQERLLSVALLPSRKKN